MPPCRFVLSLAMVYTRIRLRMALRHPTPPGQECSKGKWPLTGVRRFFFFLVGGSWVPDNVSYVSSFNLLPTLTGFLASVEAGG
jgi:hypothetical protein